eukprot:CAMPEP_0167745104 /NCGR_PEP_ID=MMETSP0110_2-20121227/2965_1 /TAXON_ID=629695 /ORGANISM="Gymnochlora sp., Strain CCMP2014" /LENGTH=86 /DNA_ID=CAMNT_0007629707 /DNA_START=323 /DNA_END=580 /DNA_ORIENTATION=+
MTNLAEFATGVIAFNMMRYIKVRGIPKKITVTCSKKCRGKVRANCSIEKHMAALKTLKDQVDLDFHVDLLDQKGDVVAVCLVQWNF